MKKLVHIAIFSVLVNLVSLGLAQAGTLAENFDEVPFSGWLTGFMGQDSNLENFYVAEGSSQDYRGNNPSGIYPSGINNPSGPIDVVFNASFGSTLTSLSISAVAVNLTTNIEIFDMSGNVLVNRGINSFYGGLPTDPASYSQIYVTSSNGISHFEFTYAGAAGGVSIDNVTVTTKQSAVPEPSSFALLGLGGIGLVIAGYRRHRTFAL